MSVFAPAPEPPTPLGRHRPLCPLAGVHLSPICLGAMSIGDGWNSKEMKFGDMDKSNSMKLLDAFWEAGGNFIDTSNNYQEESSEEFIGEWMEKKGNRENMFIATKYTTNFKMGKQLPQKTMYTGNNIKSMRVSVDASLKKLRTDYIDLLYVHWWDWTCSIEEVMDGLHNLVVQGKVLYLGVSDTPAWVVSKANMYARMSGKTPFVVYQGAWSLLQRDFEREIIPMARAEGMALCPWNVLAAGKIRSTAEENRRRESGENGRQTFAGNWERTPDQVKVCDVLEEIAKELNVKNITAIAIAYVMQKTVNVFPIIGGRKVENLHDNIEALKVALTPEHFKRIEGVLPFDVGFPLSMIGDGTQPSWLLATAGRFDRVPLQQAIRPAPAK